MERVEAYLSGRLGLEETARLEAELLQGGEVSRLLSEELMLRELLGSMPPDEAPDGLTERIERAMPLGQAPPDLSRQQPRGRTRSVLGQIGLALGGASWSVRGPAMALGPAGNNTGGRAVMEGMGTARYALGPLAGDLERRLAAAPKKKKPLWRRAAGLMWKKK